MRIIYFKDFLDIFVFLYVFVINIRNDVTLLVTQKNVSDEIVRLYH